MYDDDTTICTTSSDHIAERVKTDISFNQDSLSTLTGCIQLKNQVQHNIHTHKNAEKTMETKHLIKSAVNEWKTIVTY